MMKLLYNVDKLDEFGNPLKADSVDQKNGTEILKSNLMRREAFHYRMIDYWKSFSSLCCCCRRKCCCCYH